MANVSVVIIHFEKDELTNHVLACLDRHQTTTPADVIIIDNGSSRPYRAPNLQNSSPRVIRLEMGLGFGGACQAGLDSALDKTQPTVILNNDLSFQNNLIGGLLAAHHDHPKAGIIGPRVSYPGGRFQLSWGDDLTLCSERREKKRQTEMRAESGFLYRSREEESEIARGVQWISGAAFLITAEAARAIGGLESGYFFYFEDCDWCRRVRQVGLEVWYCPNVEVEHALGASAPLGKMNPRTRLFYRCRELGHLRYYSRFNSRTQFILLKFILILKALRKLDLALALRLLFRSRSEARSLPANWT